MADAWQYLAVNLKVITIWCDGITHPAFNAKLQYIPTDKADPVYNQRK
jgi:hypothetical protein